jgi:hypothetical protein
MQVVLQAMAVRVLQVLYQEQLPHTLAVVVVE